MDTWVFLLLFWVFSMLFARVVLILTKNMYVAAMFWTSGLTAEFHGLPSSQVRLSVLPTFLLMYKHSALTLSVGQQNGCLACKKDWCNNFWKILLFGSFDLIWNFCGKLGQLNWTWMRWFWWWRVVQYSRGTVKEKEKLKKEMLDTLFPYYSRYLDCHHSLPEMCPPSVDSSIVWNLLLSLSLSPDLCHLVRTCTFDSSYV